MSDPPTYVKQRLMSPLRLGFAATALLLALGCSKPEAGKKDPQVVGAVKLIKKDPQRALSLLEKVEGGDRAYVEYVRGLAHEGLGDSQQAELAYARSVELKPDVTESRTALARALIVSKKVDEAAQHLRAILERDKSNLLSVLLFAVVARNEEELEFARSVLRDWPKNRAATPEGMEQAPLRAEYFLTLAALEDDPERAGAATLKGAGAKIGSVGATLSLARVATDLRKEALARSLLGALVDGEVQQDQLRAIATMALMFNDGQLAQRALARIPKNDRSADVLLLRGRTELAVAHPRRAIPHFAAAREKLEGEKADQAGLLLAQARLSSPDLKATEAVMVSLLKSRPDWYQAELLMSQFELKAGRADAAVARLKKWATKKPQEPDILDRLGFAHLRAKDLPAAEQAFRARVALQPDSAEAHLRVSETLKLQKKVAEAHSYLKAAYDQHPNQLALLRAYTAQLLAQGAKDQVMQILEGSGVKTSDPVGYGLLLADTYRELKMSQEMAKTLRDLAQDHPKSARVWSALAPVLQAEKKWSELEEALRKAIALGSTSMRDRARLASVLGRHGDATKKVEAAKLFAEITETVEGDVVALNNAAVLYASELKDYAQSAELGKRAYELAPNVPAVMDTYGWALARRGKAGDLERAEKLLERAQKKLTSPESRFHYGFVLIKRGKVEEGKAILEQLLATPGEESFRDEAKSLL